MLCQFRIDRLAGVDVGFLELAQAHVAVSNAVVRTGDAARVAGPFSQSEGADAMRPCWGAGGEPPPPGFAAFL